MSHRAAILLGSNIEPMTNIPAAVAVLRAHPALTVLAVSGLYDTEPIGPPRQPRYTNAVALVETSLEPHQLRTELRQVETGLGRVRTEDRYTPRTIDLDVLLFDDLEGDFGTWQLPDPALLRPHALIPLAEIAPQWVPPGQTRSLADLAAEADRSGVDRLSPPGTSRVRFDSRREP